MATTIGAGPGPDLGRYDDWLAWLRRRGADDPDVLVVWVGGSAATGGYDEWSDLDVDVLVTPGTHDAAYERLLARIHVDFAVDHVRQRRGTGEWLVNRALARGHCAEAVDLYLRFALGPLVRLLRVEHCPWRHDYGLRYLGEDLPAGVAEELAALVPGAGPDLRSQSGHASTGSTGCWRAESGEPRAHRGPGGSPGPRSRAPRPVRCPRRSSTASRARRSSGS